VHGGEERGDIAGDEFGCFGGGEVAAAGHDGPAADGVEALGPFPGRLAFGDERMRKDRDGGRRPDDVMWAEPWLALPAAVVVIVADRGGDGGGDPVHGDNREQEVLGEPGFQVAVAVAPGPPFLQNPGGEPSWGVSEPIPEGLRFGGLDRGVAA